MKTPRLSSFLYVPIIILFSACNGGSSESAPPDPKPASVKEALSTLESTGSNPVLDRSTSVAGPDANANGVRDDVENYVASTSYSSEQKAALRQLSKAMSSALVASPSDETGLRAATAKMNDAVACIWSKYPAEKADAAILEMRKVTVNTRERYGAYVRYNAAVAGTVVKLPKETRCE